MFEFKPPSDLNDAGNYVGQMAGDLFKVCETASKGDGLAIKFPPLPPFIVTFHLRNIANEIDRLSAMAPVDREAHIKSQMDLTKDLSGVIDRLKDVFGGGFGEDDDPDAVYRRMGLEPPADDDSE